LGLGFLAAELYLVALAVLGLLAADLVVAGVAPSYLRDRAEAQAVLEELRGGRRRAKPRLVARVEELRRRLKRAAAARMAVLTPIYVALGVGALARAWPVPLSCCIPGLSVEVPGAGCVSSSALVAALAFLAFLPLVQEEAVFVLRELLRRRRNKL